MGPSIDIRGMGTVDCFCSNNYLGLANHPEVVEAGIEGLKQWGGGTASVRFICGTFTAHEAIERQIASFLGTEAAYTFVSCWTASEALFPTVCEPGDVIVSDAPQPRVHHRCDAIDDCHQEGRAQGGLQAFGHGPLSRGVDQGSPDCWRHRCHLAGH